ncbi:BTB/POZ domain-containing protein [Ditylenchus destructor]|nr:BTB/POZ domain-containing protein [Ditylenchus destructor]
MKGFARMFDDEVTSDVVLVANGKSFFAHKAILAARSEYFRNLLYGGLIESRQSRVELEDAPGEVFGILLKYLYTGSIRLGFKDLATLLDLFVLAHRYQIGKVQKYLEDHFESMVYSENVCTLLSLAIQYSLNKLVITCATFARENAQLVLSSKDFGNLSEKALHLLFALEEKIHGKLSKETLAKALTKWIQTHPNQTDTLTSALTTTDLGVEIVDGQVSDLKKVHPAMEMRAEGNKVDVSESSIENVAEELSELSMSHTAISNVNSASNSILPKPEENIQDDTRDAETFECWFDNCPRNPFSSERARNVHFGQHLKKSDEKKPGKKRNLSESSEETLESDSESSEDERNFFRTSSEDRRNFLKSIYGTSDSDSSGDSVASSYDSNELFNV